MTDAELIAGLKAGKADAYKMLYEGYNRQIYNIALGFLPNQEDAEDIVQEVLIEIYRAAPAFRGDAKLSTWVYRITVNKSLELIRKRKRKKRFAFLTSLAPGEGVDAKDNVKMNHPGLKLENKERAEVLYQAIESLSENQKIAFTLSQIDGMSYQEIQDTMGLSKSSVESLIFRARTNLKKKLKKFYENDD